MRCTLLGTGGTMPMPNRFLNSAVFMTGGSAYLFDCGEGTQVPYKAHHAGVGRLSLVAITHLHADHCLGLPGLLMLRAQMDTPEPLVVVGPAGVARFVRNVLEDLDCFVNYRIRIVEVPPEVFDKDAAAGPHTLSVPWSPEPRAGGERLRHTLITGETVAPGPDFRPGKSLLEVHRDDHVRLLCHPLDHSVFCLGYRLEERERPGKFDPARARRLGIPPGPAYARLQHGETVVTEAGREIFPHQVLGPPRRGRHVAFCTDTAPCKGLYRLLDQADLAILEGMYLPEHAVEAGEKRHLEVVKAIRIAMRAGVRTTRLSHFSPRYGAADVGRIDGLARQASDTIRAGFDGEILEIPLPD